MVRAGNWSWGISGLFAQICHWLLDYLTVLWVCLFYFLRNKKCNNQNIKKTRRFDSVQHDLQGHVPGRVRRPSVHVGLFLYPFCYLSLLCTGYNSVVPRADALFDSVYTMQAKVQDRGVCAGCKWYLINHSYRPSHQASLSDTGVCADLMKMLLMVEIAPGVDYTASPMLDYTAWTYALRLKLLENSKGKSQHSQNW